jgi:hypothetical protein
MTRRHLIGLLVVSSALAFASNLFARGQVWDFLGCTQVDVRQDHSRIQIARRDRLFRSIQVRVTGEAVFFDRLVIHFASGSSQEFAVSGRISPGGRDYVVELAGEVQALESVELWYFKEPWGQNPRVSLYGTRWSDGSVDRAAAPAASRPILQLGSFATD